jgi:hypothetical protein
MNQKQVDQFAKMKDHEFFSKYVAGVLSPEEENHSDPKLDKPSKAQKRADHKCEKAEVSKEGSYRKQPEITSYFQ